jgi:hypothetical protein
MNIKYVISRFELFGEPPTHRIVGFTISCEENDSKEYTETLVDLKLCKKKNHLDICKIAYKQLKDELKPLIRKIESKSNILGYEFIPPND